MAKVKIVVEYDTETQKFAIVSTNAPETIEVVIPEYARNTGTGLQLGNHALNVSGYCWKTLYPKLEVRTFTVRDLDKKRVYTEWEAQRWAK